MSHSLNSFVELIRNQFSEEEQLLITEKTDIKLLNEWSSLQTMIVVNEIDKSFGVILNSSDFKESNSISELYNRMKQKEQTS